jgi:vancomycin resistance protein YoaR
MDRATAERTLRRTLPDVSAGALTVRVGNLEERIGYAELGREYDLDTMLDEAFSVGRGGTPVDQVGAQMRTMMSGVSIPVAVTWDAAALAQRVAAIAADAQLSASDAFISRPDGRFTVTEAVVGQTVDLQPAVASAMAALNNTSPDSTSIEVEARSIEPAISTVQAQAAADQANSVVDEPLTVLAGGTRATIDEQTLSGWVFLDDAAPGEWKLRIDEGAIQQWVALLKRDVDVAATNASYEFEGRRAIATADADGTAIDGEAAEASILAALNERWSGEGEPQAQISLAMITVEPQFTLAQAQELVDRVRRLGSWTTRYESSVSNGFGQNIRRPTRLINGYVVQPGEEFDFVEVAGPITAANGYTGGAAIVHGNTIFDGIVGGGLCSCSTTLFNAALRAGFEITERRNHAYYLDRYPVGLDATIWINGSRVQSMSFMNDSPYPILIRGVNQANAVTFHIYGVPDGRDVRILKPGVWGRQPAWTKYEYTTEIPAGRSERLEYEFDGFNSSVERIVTDANGNVLHDDTFRSTYRRVIGHVLIGVSPDDPRAGTTVVRGKPDDA